MISRISRKAFAPIVNNFKATGTQHSFRFLGTVATKPAAPSSTPSDVVVPELFDTLEWTLSSPPPVHQFVEQPIVVEIEHLEHLKPMEVTYDD